jgi:uncharacterized protein YcgI (DUF1989 family)
VLHTKIIVPGGEGKAFFVQKGQYVVVKDLEGKQVADFIAFRADQRNEFVSTNHTCTMNGRLILKKDDFLYSNLRLPLLKMVKDTVGTHDLMFPCCDPQRYKQDFGIKNHRNCRENFVSQLESYGISYTQMPNPVNVFQNTPVHSDGTIGEAHEPRSQPGDYVVFKALVDLVAAISACPQDQTPLCGWKITDIGVDIRENLNRM